MKKIMKKKTKARTITKNMEFSEILKKYPELAEVFIEEGMHCIGCPMAGQETIGQGCKAHGINADKLIEKLNKKLKKT